MNIYILYMVYMYVYMDIYGKKKCRDVGKLASCSCKMSISECNAEKMRGIGEYITREITKMG